MKTLITWATENPVFATLVGVSILTIIVLAIKAMNNDEETVIAPVVPVEPVVPVIPVANRNIVTASPLTRIAMGGTVNRGGMNGGGMSGGRLGHAKA